ncbi:MAG: class I SAM-dependent methyltransferase [Candidatus Omnitrophota bacterium]
MSGKVVLDAACGSGFGSEILSQKAKKVVGVDISWEAIQHCKAYYKKPNLSFIQMDCNSLTFHPSNFDIVISFETLEHIQNAELFLEELKRALRKGGLLIISTPNRENFSIYTRGIKNPYHFREFTVDEFRKLIGNYFKLEHLLGQKYFAKKDIPLLAEYTTKEIPYGSDNVVRRLIRVGLRAFLPAGTRSDRLLDWEVWSNKCKVGDVIPQRAVYLVGICRKVGTE